MVFFFTLSQTDDKKKKKKKKGKLPVNYLKKAVDKYHW